MFLASLVFCCVSVVLGRVCFFLFFLLSREGFSLHLAARLSLFCGVSSSLGGFYSDQDPG